MAKRTVEFKKVSYITLEVNLPDDMTDSEEIIEFCDKNDTFEYTNLDVDNIATAQIVDD